MGSRFIITELRRDSLGALVDSGVEFIWSSTEQTAPANEWSYGISLVTARDENPGSKRPTEQVLNAKFDDFTLNGKWDDRYAGAGFANATRRSFEEFIGRGGLARISIDDISVIGVIKQLEIGYRHRTKITYSFTVSAHYREDDLLHQASSRLSDAVGAAGATSPIAFADLAQVEVDAAIETHALYPMALEIRGEVASEIGESVSGWRDRLEEIRRSIDLRLGEVESQVDAAARIGHLFGALKTDAIDTLARLRGLTTTANLAFEHAIPSLEFDFWSRDLQASALRLILRADEARREMLRRDQPRAVAIHTARRGESLYKISRLYYGTPFQWQIIAERNGLTGPTGLVGGELLVIPESVGQ